MINMKFLNLLILLFLLYIDVSSSSSCEELQNTIYNLSSGSNCGRIGFQGTNFQLDCEGNNPIIYIQSTKFLVKNISFQRTTFRLVDSSYSATGDHCYLPNQTIFEELNIFSYNDGNFSFIYFVNCTQEIENSRYELVPCLNRTNFRVYAIASKRVLYYASDLPDSCSLVGQAITEYIDTPLEHVGYAAIVHAIEEGVLVNWSLPLCASDREECWIYYFWSFEQWKGFNFTEVLLQPLQIAFSAFLLYWPFEQLKGFSEVLLLSLRPASFLPLSLYWVSSFLECLYPSSNIALTFTLIFVVLFGIVLLARIFLTPLAVCSLLIHKWRRMSLSVSSTERFLRSNELLHIRHYDFIEISIMTNHFREKLGQGGFGSVYKGKLLSGQQVAVKILSNTVGEGDDFISEVATIGRIHHANIVWLIGFCSEGSKRALIYAYMPNGSLDKYIFSFSNTLSMEKRREIAIGIARGIDYLHRGCEMQILHFDIKPHNILLDHNLTPKISDFGLARLYPKDYSLVTLSMARGTIGYIAPELISRTFGAISYKADVYSFGMLLMEMASGRRNVDNHAESSSQVYYPSWIYDQLNLPDEIHNFSSYVRKFGEIEERLYKVALWCIQMKASNRPTMTRVIEMLQNDANSLEIPPRPSMACTHEFSVRPSGNISSNIELSLISEEISVH